MMVQKKHDYLNRDGKRGVVVLMIRVDRSDEKVSGGINSSEKK